MIVLHASAAVAALLLGTVLILLRKGTSLHKALGRIWVPLMAVVAVSSFWITREGGYSWIHGLSAWTLASLACAVYFVRRGNIRSHRYFMAGAYLGLVAAGAGALAPGRLLHLLLLA